MHDPSSMALAFSFSENDINTKTRQKFTKSVNRKKRLRVNIYGSFEPHLSRSMHDPSFIALAIIVSEKMS